MTKTTLSSTLFLPSLSFVVTSLPLITATCTFPDSPESSSSLPSHNIKGMFIFGSSYVDNGNNNFLQNNMAKVNYTPYGIDFALGPTGRYTNGKNVIDLLGEQLELPSYIPVFSSPGTKGRKIINGVDFASGGSGILDDTGSLAGVISLRRQIKNFEAVTSVELEEQVGCRSQELLPNYLFVLGVGGNDYSLNYFPRRAKGYNVTLKAFTSHLITSLTLHIQKLYDLGAQKFMMMSLYPIGCNPVVRASQPDKKGCVSIFNKAARGFNTRLKSMVDKTKQHMPDSNFVYVNAYKVIWEIIRDPVSKGFRDAITACCEMTLPGGLCKKRGSTCANRNTHVYFDGIHPTQAVNKLIAKSAFTSNHTIKVYPINARQLTSI